MKIAYENGELVPVEASEEELKPFDDEIDPELRSVANRLAYRLAGDMLRQAMIYIVDDPAPKLAADVMGSAFGLRLRQGMSDSELAARHGISKEAFDQRKKRFLKLLGLKRVVVRGSKRHTTKYRDANFRHAKRTII